MQEIVFGQGTHVFPQRPQSFGHGVAQLVKIYFCKALLQHADLFGRMLRQDQQIHSGNGCQMLGQLP
ncbi:hypothetical protein D3C81_2297970 [compost metagenome]